MGSQTALSLREKEQKNYKSYVAIDINFPPLQAAAKQGPCSLKRWKGAKDEQRRDGTYVYSGVHRIGSICREGDSPKNGITKDKPTAAKMLRGPVQLLRRLLKPCKAYPHGDGQMSYDELLSFGQSLDQLCSFTAREKMLKLRDFNGGKNRS